MKTKCYKCNDVIEYGMHIDNIVCQCGCEQGSVRSSKSNPYFVNDLGEVVFFSSKDQRDGYADHVISEYRDEFDGWDEDVLLVYTGCINSIVEEKDLILRPDQKHIDEDGLDMHGVYWGDFEYMCSYKLTNV